jgi:hypothetical protein
MATKALFNEKVDAVMRQLREEYFPRGELLFPLALI